MERVPRSANWGKLFLPRCSLVGSKNLAGVRVVSIEKGRMLIKDTKMAQ